MARYVYDRDMDCLVEVGDFSNREPPVRMGAPVGIIRDIAPYRTAAADVAAGNKRVMITGRRQHREFLKRNGYVEVGNDSSLTRPRQPVALDRGKRAQDIKRAIEQLRSR